MILILVSIISYDIWFYISHVALHSQIMYKYHKLHHTKSEPTYVDTYLASNAETVFQGGGVFFPSMVYKPTLFELAMALLLINMRGMMAHDRRFVFLIGNHHLLHHKYHNCNYGQYWIDSLLGTLHPVKAERRSGLLYT